MLPLLLVSLGTFCWLRNSEHLVIYYLSSFRVQSGIIYWCRGWVTHCEQWEWCHWWDLHEILLPSGECYWANRPHQLPTFAVEGIGWDSRSLRASFWDSSQWTFPLFEVSFQNCAQAFCPSMIFSGCSSVIRNEYFTRDSQAAPVQDLSKMESLDDTAFEEDLDATRPEEGEGGARTPSRKRKKAARDRPKRASNRLSTHWEMD